MGQKCTRLLAIESWTIGHRAREGFRRSCHSFHQEIHAARVSPECGRNRAFWLPATLPCEPSVQDASVLPLPPAVPSGVIETDASRSTGRPVPRFRWKRARRRGLRKV